MFFIRSLYSWCPLLFLKQSSSPCCNKQPHRRTKIQDTKRVCVCVRSECAVDRVRASSRKATMDMNKEVENVSTNSVYIRGGNTKQISGLGTLKLSRVLYRKHCNGQLLVTYSVSLWGRVRLEKDFHLPFWASPPWGHRDASTSPQPDAGSSPGYHRCRGNAAAARWSWARGEVEDKGVSKNTKFNCILAENYSDTSTEEETDQFSVVCHIETSILTC